MLYLFRSKNMRNPRPRNRVAMAVALSAALLVGCIAHSGRTVRPFQVQPTGGCVDTDDIPRLTERYYFNELKEGDNLISRGGVVIAQIIKINEKEVIVKLPNGKNLDRIPYSKTKTFKLPTGHKATISFARSTTKRETFGSTFESPRVVSHVETGCF